MAQSGCSKSGFHSHSPSSRQKEGPKRSVLPVRTLPCGHVTVTRTLLIREVGTGTISFLPKPGLIPEDEGRREKTSLKAGG